MSASGPGESYLGDPLWTSLGDWADQQRARSDLVVAVHFPYPNAELAADITRRTLPWTDNYCPRRSPSLECQTRQRRAIPCPTALDVPPPLRIAHG